ncbi:PepSY-associated TM helix domain-containing protein [Pelagibius sp.]
MKPGFRQSMAWLHTWSGLVVGWLLFAIFLTGTASFYRHEITQWMQPELRQMAPAADAAAVALERLHGIAPGARRWLVDLPDERDPVAHLYVWRDPGEFPSFQREALDTVSREPVVARATYGGDFLFYFHFDLNMPSIWGRLIVGAATIIMLVAMISGVITHRRIFKDFFTFRPGKVSHRSWLDAHNVLAVMALPFHLMITYTGLITLMFLYMPWGRDVAYQGDQQAFLSEASLSTTIPAAANIAAPLVPIGPVIEEAVRRWDGAAVGRIDVYRPGDANARIELTSSDAAQIAFHRRKVTFDGTTGRIVAATDRNRWAAETQAVMYGLHIGRFAEPFVRLLYFVSSLAGTAMIATGLVLWVVKRCVKRDAPEKAGAGRRLVEILNVGTIVGLPIAMAAFFWANRLLPVERASRADMEAGCFFLAWILAFIHPILRSSRRAWIEQLAFAAFLFSALPIVNAATTGSHLGATLPEGNWVLAGFDLTMLATGLLLGWIAWHVGRKRPTGVGPGHPNRGLPVPAEINAERREA